MSGDSIFRASAIPIAIPMHLEATRYSLYLESIAFLLANDEVARPPDAR